MAQDSETNMAAFAVIICLLFVGIFIVSVDYSTVLTIVSSCANANPTTDIISAFLLIGMAALKCAVIGVMLFLIGIICVMCYKCIPEAEGSSPKPASLKN